MASSINDKAKLLLVLVVLGLTLLGCRADDDMRDTESVVTHTETVTVTTGNSQSKGMLFAHRLVEEITEAGGALMVLEEMASASMEDADELFQNLEDIPDRVLVQARPYGKPDVWAMATGVEPGDALGISYFTDIGVRQARRDGYETLDASRMDAVNQAVRDALTPGVESLLSPMRSPESLSAEDTLENNDQDMLALYSLALNSMVMAVNDDEDEGSLSPSSADDGRMAVAMEDLGIDGGSGVFDGRNVDGAPVSGLNYNPLTFVSRYATALQGGAFKFADEDVQNFIADSQYSRFVSPDLRCSQEFVEDYFAENAGELALEATRVDGYEAYFDEGNTYGFILEEDGSLAFFTENDEGNEHVTLTADDLFTCSAASDTGEGKVSLVRFVVDMTGDGEREEVVIVGTGEAGLAGQGPEGGIYIASERSNRVAVFGDADPTGGYDEPQPDEPESESTACGITGYESFARNGQGTTATGETFGLTSSVSNPEQAADGDLTTAAALRVRVGSALNFARLLVGKDTPPMTSEEAGQVAILASVPDSLLSLGLLDSVTITTLRDGEEQASDNRLNLLSLDLAGLLNQSDMRVITMDAGNQAFDQVNVELRAGLLSVDAQIQVFDICYGP